MTDTVTAKGLNGGTVPLSGATIDALREQLDGSVVLPGDYGYDQLREIWNAHIDRRPALIIRVGSAADVEAAVTFVAEHELLVSVRGGGHQVAGIALADGGVLIDTKGLTGVRVDPVARRSYVQPGATWFDYDRACQAYGLASPGGAISHTGVTGLTLGGGFGWLSGTLGLAVDNVVSFDVVTPDGVARHADADENPDLFWALRGGGGNFGVVTQIEFRLHEVGLLYGGILLVPAADAKKLLEVYADYLPNCADEFSCSFGYAYLQDGTSVFGGPVSYNGSPVKGEPELLPFRTAAPPVVDQFGPLRYTELQKMSDQQMAEHRRYYVKSGMLKRFQSAMFDEMADSWETATGPFSTIMFQHFGNAATRVAPDATAYGHRDCTVEFITLAGWLDPRQDEEQVEWGRSTARRLEPFSEGQYVNHADLPEEEEQWKGTAAAFGSNWKRLLELKRRYDPTNQFRHNQNIPVAVPVG